ncbi:MAG: hypothetical protein JWM50_173 [Microbacteriaceae bacterium]|nr:hypothetical protein [Microbacteriaceae bacterium]
MTLRSPRSAAATLAATALVFCVLSLLLMFSSSGMWAPLRTAMLVVSGVAAPLLMMVALLLLVSPALRLGRGYETGVAAAASLAIVGDLLLVLSFSVGMEEGDTGNTPSLFGGLTWVFALVSAAGFAAFTALMLFAVLRRRPGSAGWVAAAISGGVAIIAAPFLVWSFASPLTATLPALAVAVAAFYDPSAARRLPGARLRTVADARHLARRVRTLALSSFVYTVVVWVGAVSASIAATGTDAAGPLLGTAAAAAQLAVVPLLLAGTIVVEARSAGGTRPLWIGTAASVGAVGVVAVSMVAAYGPDGDAFVRGLGVLALAVGVWLGTLTWALGADRTTPARGALAAVAVLGGAATYLLGAALTAGMTLALVSGFLAFGGTRLVFRRPTTTTTPETLPASA